MTRKYRFVLTVTVALASLAAIPARAQNQPSDIKCLLLSNLYSKRADDEKARATALQASFFYLGRVTGSAAQIQARLAEEAKNLSATDNGQAMAACANAMAKRADELATATDPKPAQQEGR